MDLIWLWPAANITIFTVLFIVEYLIPNYFGKK